MDGEPARWITTEALDEKQQVKFMNKRWKVLSHVVRKRGNTLVIAITCSNFHCGWVLICFLAAIGSTANDEANNRPIVILLLIFFILLLSLVILILINLVILILLIVIIFITFVIINTSVAF